MSETQRKPRQAAWAAGTREARIPGLSGQQNVHGLDPAPIPQDWILQGTPITRCRKLWNSTDDMAFTVMWDCTAGRFNWFYDIDETICVLEGSVILTSDSGERRTLRPMDTFYFPCGTRYHWNIPVYVRKVAFIHVPLTQKLRTAQRAWRLLKGVLQVGRGSAVAAGPGAALGAQAN